MCRKKWRMRIVVRTYGGAFYKIMYVNDLENTKSDGPQSLLGIMQFTCITLSKFSLFNPGLLLEFENLSNLIVVSVPIKSTEITVCN